MGSKARDYGFQRMTIGERIRWLIEHRGYTQVEVAEKCNVTQAAISNLVTDSSRKPNAYTLDALTDALDTNSKWILYGTGEVDSRLLPDRPDEAALLRTYRAMTDAKKQGLLDFLGIKL